MKRLITNHNTKNTTLALRQIEGGIMYLLTGVPVTTHYSKLRKRAVPFDCG